MNMVDLHRQEVCHVFGSRVYKILLCLWSLIRQTAMVNHDVMMVPDAQDAEFFRSFDPYIHFSA